MSKRWNRPAIWIGLIVLAIGGLGTAILGLHVYMTVTATPLHPEAQAVPSVATGVPAPAWLKQTDQGRRLVRAALAEQNLAGLSVAVGSGGEVVWAEGFGWADLDDHVKVTPDTRFRLGTASTVLTAAAAGLLIERNRLKLEEPIQTYVPEFPKKPWPVTPRGLMGHVAGLDSDSGDESALFSQHCERAAEGLRSFADDSLLFEPGTRYHYSRYGWIVMSAAIEAAADEPFLAFMKQQVFEPLGLAHTRDGYATTPLPNTATSYFPRYAADPHYGLDPMRDIDLSCYAGAAAFLSTPTDLVRFGMAVQSGTFLRPETVTLLQTSQRLASGQTTGYGLGWDLETVTIAGRQVPVVGHDGDLLGGTIASLITVPDRGLVVAVISNTSYADTFAVAATIAEAFSGPAR